MSGATENQALEDPAVVAVANALEECDHARLPAWMVAQIAVESIRSSFGARSLVDAAD